MRILPDSAAFTIVLGIFAGIPALSIDISAPSLVELPAALQSTTPMAGLTISSFMIGFAAGQLIGGRLSDARGRRPVLRAGLLTYVLAGIACAVATTGLGLVGARLLQGIGAGACAVLALAIVQDLFEGETARRKRSQITTVIGLAPVLAPALGVWLHDIAGWRSVYLIPALAGLGLLAVTWSAVPESRWSRGPAPPLIAQPVPLLRDTRFITIVVVNALSYSALFAYVAGGPVVTIGWFGFSPAVYAAVFAGTAAALSAGAFTSARLGRRGVGARAIVGPGLAAQAAAALLMALIALRASNAAILILPLLLIASFARGAVSPNLAHIAMGTRQNDAGVASASLGVVQLAGGAVASGVVALMLPFLALTAVTTTMAVLGAAAALLWLFAERLRVSRTARNS